MAGLLDALNSDEGLFGLSLLAAAAPRAGGRTSLGEGLLGASQMVAQRRQQAQEQAMRQQMQQAQLAEFQAKAQERQSAIAQAQQQAQRQQQVGELIGREDVTPQQLLAMGVPVEVVKARFEAKNYGRSKVARTIDGKDAQGRPITLQLDEFGQPMGEAVPQWKAPIQADTGGAVNFIDPSTLSPLATLKKSNTPDALLSAETSRRGQNMVDARSRESNANAAAAALGGPAKPLPPGALKMQQEALDSIGVASSINADLGAIEKQIDGGRLKFGPVSNLLNTGRNMAGLSSEESRNFSTFKSSLERLRNESLRLNAGVQTDGDAQRAWNELFQNVTDTGLVKQRLQEIQRINARAVQLQRLKIDSIRGNYGAGPLDDSGFVNQAPAINAPPSGANIDALVNKYRSK
jgi:hypothetical protein